jgi:general nucleoside transport system permease protein
VSGEVPSSVPAADAGLDSLTLAPDQIPGGPNTPVEPPSRTTLFVRDLLGGNVIVTILAVVIAFVVGGILIVATDPNVQGPAAYFFGRPSDTLSAIWHSVSNAYADLFRGGVYDFTSSSFADGIGSFLSSLGYATPLIVAGLGIAVGFRSGVFNIGGQGQVLAGAAAAGYVGFAWDLPPGLHIVVAVLAGILGGAVTGGIVGLLKARTGANEVIVTIMLNYIVFYLLDFLLHTSILRAPGSQNPQTPAEKDSAIYPGLFGSSYSVNIGFLITIVATIFCWWLLSRSSLGFKLRAVGENPRAARVAGIRINRMYIYVMVISGVLVGLAGVYQVLGQTTTGFGTDIDAGIGFNAITVTLLGRSRPWGVFAAGILFGVLQAGSYTMQAADNVNVNIVQIIQSVIVLFLAAPPLVRAIFRLPDPSAPPRRKRQKVSTRKAVAAK